MEPEGSLPHSQVSATCPNPQPAWSSPYPNIPLPEDPYYYYSPIYAWVSPLVSFPKVSPPKTSIHLPLPHTRYLSRPSHTSSFYHPNNIVWVKNIKFLICSFLHSRYFIPLRSKYSPQHPILKKPQPAFLPHCERPSFTPIQNRQNYTSVCL